MGCSDRKPVYFVNFVILGVLRDHFVLVTKATKTCEFSRGFPIKKLLFFGFVVLRLALQDHTLALKLGNAGRNN